MPRINPEQAAAAIAAVEQNWAESANKPGYEGAQARGFPIVKAYYAWYFAEMERGTAPDDTLAGCSGILGMIAVTVASSIGAEGETPADLIGEVLDDAETAALTFLDNADYETAEIEETR